MIFVVEINSYSVTLNATNAATAVSGAIKWFGLKKKEIYYIRCDRLK